MSEQDRFKEIAKTAAGAIAMIKDMTRELVDQNTVLYDLSELTFQLGYIEGLSYVPEVDNDK
jgi:hypothetical protein